MEGLKIEEGIGPVRLLNARKLIGIREKLEGEFEVETKIESRVSISGGDDNNVS